MLENQISDHSGAAPIPRLSRDVVKALEAKSNLHGLLACSRVGLALLFCYFVLARFGLGGWTAVAVFIAIGTLQHHLFIIQHEALHFYLFRSRTANEFFGGLAGLLVGFPLSYRHHHLLHHRRLGFGEDPDVSNYEKPFANTRQLFTRLLAGLSGLATFRQLLAYHLGLGPKPTDKAEKPKGRHDLHLLIATQLAVFALFGWGLGPVAYIAFWILPLFTIAKTLNSLRNYAEHASFVAGGRGDVDRLVSIRSNWLEKLFFAPLNFNYHAEHHLYTTVPYYNLPALHRELQRAGCVFRIEKSYLSALIRTQSLPTGKSKHQGAR